MNLINTQFVILSCDSYLDSRINVLNETWAKNTNRIFLIDSEIKESADTIGYNTPKNYEGIQEKYINLFLRYDFSKFEYIKSRVNSTIICKRCKGDFQSSPNNYLTGARCPFCKNKTELLLYDKLKKYIQNLNIKLKALMCSKSKSKYSQ
jgi:hypothetical protein